MLKRLYIHSTLNHVRKTAEDGISKQVTRMIDRGNRSLHSVHVGCKVAVPISQFGRSKSDPPNVIGIVTDIDSVIHRIGTHNGTVSGWLAKNQFEFVRGYADVPEIALSVREIVRAQIVCGGHGYKCKCRSKCLTNTCSCLKSALRSNSAYHSHKSSANWTERWCDSETLYM